MIYKKITYKYISRYAPFHYYYHTKDKKYMYGLTSHLSTETPYIEIVVEKGDTLDLLADKYYGRPDYFHIIADFNRIADPFINLSEYYKKIKIPALASIEYNNDR